MEQKSQSSQPELVGCELHLLKYNYFQDAWFEDQQIESVYLSVPSIKTKRESFEKLSQMISEKGDDGSVVSLVVHTQKEGNEHYSLLKECFSEVGPQVVSLRYVILTSESILNNSKDIFQVLANCPNLKELEMSFQGLDNFEASFEELPKVLEKMKQLLKLRINFSKHLLDFECCEQIAASLPYLQNLKQLQINLENSFVSQVGGQELRSSISELPNLEYLQLNLSSTSEGSSGFLEGDYGFPNLKVLILDFKEGSIEHAQGEQLGSLLEQCPKLTFFIINATNISYNSKVGYQTVEFGLRKKEEEPEEELKENDVAEENNESYSCQKISKFVFELDINSQEILPPVINSILNELYFETLSIKIQSASQLQKKVNCFFYLQKEQIENIISLNLQMKSIILVPAEYALFLKQLSSYSNLQTLVLNMQSMKIGVLGVGKLANALKELKKLKTLILNVGNNNIIQANVSVLFEQIATLEHLKVLEVNLGGNLIPNDGATQIYFALNSLSQKTKLVGLKINLYNCGLEYKEFDYLVNSIPQFQNLLKVSLTGSPIKMGHKIGWRNVMQLKRLVVIEK